MNFAIDVNYIKVITAAIGGYLLALGQSIEPQVAIWVISLGGSLLWITLGEDSSIKKIFFNIVISLMFGIFGSQISFVLWPLLPRLPVCFFLSMFGVPISLYIIRNLKEANITDLISSVLEKLIPWKGKKNDT
jgi:hypothetical protein